MSVKLSDWYANFQKPVRAGHYEVRNSVPLHWKKKGKLVGSWCRYWDGEQWMTYKGGEKSIFGTHHTHQWRGLASDPSKP